MKTIIVLLMLLVLTRAFAQTASYSEQIVAAVLVGEAGIDGRIGMEAVAEVVLNRAVEKSDSYLSVVTKHYHRRYQFGCLNGVATKDLLRKSQKNPNFEQALQIAITLHRHPAQLPRRVYGANHYIEDNLESVWSEGQTPVARIGHHRFYRLNS